MKTTNLLTVLLLLAAAAAHAADLPNEDLEAHRATCRTAMEKLGDSLKSALQAAMKEGGPINALGVCNVKAVPIAETISTEEGLLVGRTALKTRNPDNAPDGWEEATLLDFQARLDADEKLKDLEAWTVITDDAGHRTFRYMKAIGTMPMCLKCHGERLDSEVAARVAELYPQDRAVGFKAGDLRGAFSVRMPLD
ncbi:MAG TPA: DUF3365 domain-containing protein [Candidatus Krumholzibacteria bacterium]|nr:DUF3365 domain-containing protein [Candidatus Krumholzibacteria bacterium]HRX51357.1 DUF3365 domain-containing protein [Candidatus Krumholzibacteria bacterium]